MSDRALLRIREPRGIARPRELVATGVPLPRGLARESSELCVCTAAGAQLPWQGRVLARWNDRSIRWLLVEAMCEVPSHADQVLYLQRARPDMPATPRGIRLVQADTHLLVDTGTTVVQVSRTGGSLLSAVHVGDTAIVDAPGLVARLTDDAGRSFRAHVDQWDVAEEAPLAVTLCGRGRFDGPGVLPLRFEARLRFVAGSALLRLEFTLHNPRPALHRGGLWDLGDPGSVLLRDVTLSCTPAVRVDSLRWHAEDAAGACQSAAGPWLLHQDSSGGERWDSPNHVDRDGGQAVAFRGYRVAAGGEVVSTGNRATPSLCAAGTSGWVAATVLDFWQCFPKALRWDPKGELQAALFPAESAAQELQGGEQKRHVVLFEFGTAGAATELLAAQHPVEATVDAGWIEQSGAITWFTARTAQDDRRYTDYVDQIVQGGQSAFAKREIIDEFGWRNFGDLYADHEAVHHQGNAPFISHYNNQYDFIYGAFLQFQRTGDARWRELMVAAARHCIDIDIYHTEGDKAAFNGGLFWHTDHYRSAATCTHRTYSRHNGAGRDYGGGPSNEHNYTSGLLHYYYLTADVAARDAVIGLADWVIGMDDGSRNILGLVDAGPTGAASATVSRDYHKAGRGAGNSINALLDAWQLAGRRHYMSKAEELIQRCIHPRDDIAALTLDAPEHRWSYLVFLQVLAKYLEVKAALQEHDYCFYYARDSLLHYARWMLQNEVPYRDVLHKVELPTETWPAHDIRKCHVLDAAARFVPGPESDHYRARARFFFDRCIDDLRAFPTAALTRPQVILAVYGSLHEYFRRHAETPGDAQALSREHAYEFGMPLTFLPQRARLAGTLRARVGLLRRTVAGVVNAVMARVRVRRGGGP